MSCLSYAASHFAVEKPFRLVPLLIAVLATFPVSSQAVTDAPVSKIINPGSLNSSGPWPGILFITQISGVSDDGNVVVGGATDGGSNGELRAFRWTEASGMMSLGTLAGSTYSHATGVGSHGNVVVGFVGNTSEDRESEATVERAFRWTKDGGMESLGTVSNRMYSAAWGVSGNGEVVVGVAFNPSSDPEEPMANPLAFRWSNPISGMVSLGALNQGSGSMAFGANGDGSVVVGVALDGAAGNAVRAFRWTESGGMASLGTLNGGDVSEAKAVNSAGNVVVGYATDGTAGNAERAFLWHQGSRMMGLGTLNGGNASEARAVNSDGSVVVGQASVNSANNDFRAFRWTQATGMQSVDSWLAKAGVFLAPGAYTWEATGVSADGSVVVGNFPIGQSFIARVVPGSSVPGDDPSSPVNPPPSPGIGNGLITLQDYYASLAGSVAMSSMTTRMGNLVLNGALSRPLARRVQAGKSCFWTAGDIGRDDHGSRDGSMGLAQLGACHAFTTGMQSTLSIGHTWNTQNLAFNGESRVEATFGTAGLLANVPGTSLWASATLLYQRGAADVRRGYLNAFAQDFSKGSTDVSTTALRLRLDWEGAARLGNATLTPYADLSRARSRVDGYTETGGGFPASFNARTEHATELRLGTDATLPLASGTNLLGRIEAAHRFEKTGAATSGTVLGLFGFSQPGEQVKRDWVRAGVGFDTKLGGGKFSTMLNATTQGAAPSYWLNVDWQKTF